MAGDTDRRTQRRRQCAGASHAFYSCTYSYSLPFVSTSTSRGVPRLGKPRGAASCAVAAPSPTGLPERQLSFRPLQQRLSPAGVERPFPVRGEGVRIGGARHRGRPPHGSHAPWRSWSCELRDYAAVRRRMRLLLFCGGWLPQQLLVTSVPIKTPTASGTAASGTRKQPRHPVLQPHGTGLAFFGVRVAWRCGPEVSYTRAGGPGDYAPGAAPPRQQPQVWPRGLHGYGCWCCCAAACPERRATRACRGCLRFPCGSWRRAARPAPLCAAALPRVTALCAAPDGVTG